VVSDPTLNLLAYSKAWTPGTNGPITADAVDAVIRTEADFARLRGTLKGKFAMILPGPSSTPPAVAPPLTYKRFTDEELLKMAAGPSAPPAAATAAPRPATPAAPATPPAPGTGSGFFAWVENALSAPAARNRQAQSHLVGILPLLRPSRATVSQNFILRKALLR